MLNKIAKETIQLIYVRWSNGDAHVCSQCGSPVRYLYNDGGRYVLTLTGTLKLFTCYYVCTNEKCAFATPFTLPHDIVLPYKHYGLDVWYFAITSHLKFHDAYSSIAERLKEYFALDISPNTVKAIIETFLVASSQEADQETARQVRESGRLYLALDGQKPNNGESGLWLFIDTLTNRIVHLEYLNSASWDILAKIFQKIEKKYGVPIEAVISDHQKSIIKAVKNALPGIPHQFCHYHFLKNLHRTLNALDSHLHVKLAEAVSDLYICNLPQTVVDNALQKRGLDLRAWILPIVNDLSALTHEHTRDFDIFAGFNSYQRLTEYTELLEQFAQAVKRIERLASLVEKTITVLRRTLKEQTALYLKIKVLLPLFHECRALLGATTPAKDAMRSQAARWRNSLQELYKTLTGHLIAPDIKNQQVSAETPLADILAEWNRLYSTHEEGLFHYLHDPKLPRSNVALEKMFSLELHHFRTAFGKSQVGNLVRVKGGELCVVLQDYNPDSITRVLLAQDRTRVQEGRSQFRERQKQQSNSWHTKEPKVPAICQLIEKAKKHRKIS